MLYNLNGISLGLKTNKAILLVDSSEVLTLSFTFAGLEANTNTTWVHI